MSINLYYPHGFDERELDGETEKDLDRAHQKAERVCALCHWVTTQCKCDTALSPLVMTLKHLGIK